METDANQLEGSSVAATSGPDERQVQAVSDWLIAQGLTDAEFEDVLEGFAEGLLRIGIPVSRGSIQMRTLHPSIEALNFVWDGPGSVSAQSFTIDERENEYWLRSPVKYMLDNEISLIRVPLETLDGAHMFPMMNELADNGGTDYYLRMIGFDVGDAREVSGLVSSWTTAKPGGFEDWQIAVIDRMLPRLALTAKARLTKEIAENVLDTYVGQEAGRRVMEGNIHRGDLDVIPAVIIFADLRGFTTTTDTVPRDRLGEMLDNYFEAIVPALVDGGGQVLKYLGDGLLGAFNLEDLPQDSVCSGALQAAVNMRRNVAKLNEARSARGWPVMDLDIAIHLGDVLYGNVGAADRLDFTVIGPAVNEASRIEALSEDLDCSLLVSETFAKAATQCGSRLRSLGRHALRGVRGDQEIFAVIEE